MTTEQNRAMRQAVNAYQLRNHEETNAGRWCATALHLGVPLNTLARALGVSRTRVLALASHSEGTDGG